ncbi:hypothetical protein FRC02_004821 [Tulasnella sp. 418]|nr:hypothetical protein FRC02_004821 [Tulasnella sp. 418]
MSGRKIGTVIVVVLKGKNLPNKRHIGKQDPYCVLKLNGETRRTKAVKRGGQHPDWDDELRFPLYESMEDELARGNRSDGGDSPPPPPPKDNGSTPKKKSKQTLFLSCYADDPREPDLVGDCTVDLTEALTKGEMDEWFTLMNKQKYSGEIYLEITFWSEEAPPVKQQPPQPSKLHPQYGGAGRFTPAGEQDLPSSLQPNGYSPQGKGRSSTGGRVSTGGRPSMGKDDPLPIPESLRPSSSLANLNLYIPNYTNGEPTPTQSPSRRGGRVSGGYGRDSYDQQGGYDHSEIHSASGYEELGVGGGYSRRRESFPPPNHHAPRHGSWDGPSRDSLSYPPSDFAGPASLASSMSRMSLGAPPIQQSSGFQRSTSGSFSNLPPAGFAAPGNYQQPYQPQAPPVSMHPGPSGFMAPPTPMPSTYAPPPPGPQYPQSGFVAPPQGGYVPPSSSLGYHPPASHFGAPAQVPYPSSTPAPYGPGPGTYPPSTPAPYPTSTPAPTQYPTTYPPATPAPAFQQQPSFAPPVSNPTPAPYNPQGSYPLQNQGYPQAQPPPPPPAQQQQQQPYYPPPPPTHTQSAPTNPHHYPLPSPPSSAPPAQPPVQHQHPLPMHQTSQPLPIPPSSHLPPPQAIPVQPSSPPRPHNSYPLQVPPPPPPSSISPSATFPSSQPFSQSPTHMAGSRPLPPQPGTLPGQQQPQQPLAPPPQDNQHHVRRSNSLTNMGPVSVFGDQSSGVGGSSNGFPYVPPPPPLPFQAPPPPPPISNSYYHR